MEKNISYRKFKTFIENYYLQSVKELKEMDEIDKEERCCDNEREGVELNSLENVMGQQKLKSLSKD